MVSLFDFLHETYILKGHIILSNLFNNSKCP